MIDFLIALTGGLGIGAAAIAVCYGYRADTYKKLGYHEEASKYYKIFGAALLYIIIWVALGILFPTIGVIK